MTHRFSNNVFSPQGVFIHTSCVNCGAIANTAKAQAACPHSLQSSGDFKFNINIIIICHHDFH